MYERLKQSHRLLKQKLEFCTIINNKSFNLCNGADVYTRNSRHELGETPTQDYLIMIGQNSARQ